ncbi:MAG: SocA family protein [Candidatus Buchananbacteria bacterium]|jgi:uncharacterized phage-associated protein|nr:SocA family protein [Candidatus Buchananbacteria bacterium]
MSKINFQKYQDVIAYLCEKLGGEIQGKKKLAKLLYFADFDFFEKYQRPITGDTYRAFPMGPLPLSLDAVTAKMIEDKLLLIEQVDKRPGYHPLNVYKCTVDCDYSNLDAHERAMLNRVIAKYGHLNGKQLEDISHMEAPYLGTEAKNDIPYELAMYRSTDFSDLQPVTAR